MLAWTGAHQLLLTALVPRLMAKFGPALIVLVFALFAASNFLSIHLNQDTGTDQLLFSNIVRAIGQALVLTPL